MTISKQEIVFLTILIPFFSITSQAQNNFTGYFEPAIEVSYQVSPKYSHSFGVENRNYIYRRYEMAYNVKQIDMSHFSEYRWRPQYAIGLGLQYRLENAFEDDEENEFRIQEQVVYTPKTLGFEVSHRLRAEQLLYASLGKHRFRYQLGYQFPLAKENMTQPYINVSTESLLELAKTQKPEFEQRFEVSFGWMLNAKTTLQLGVEYQLADYVQDLNHELFLNAELGIAL